MTEVLTNYLKLSQTNNADNTKLLEAANLLLITLPSSRQNVFEDFDTLYKNILTEFLAKGKDNSENDLHIALNQIEKLIISFILKSSGWTNFIFSWSLKLLANISQDYSDFRPYSLENSFLYWTTNPPAQSILRITAQCLATRNEESNLFEETSFLVTNFSIHSEWLVSYIGLAFPSHMIKKLFIIGLKEFKKLNTTSSGNRQSLKDFPISLPCIIQIIDYLSNQHFQTIQDKLTYILTSNDSVLEKYRSYVPKYFFHLASQSDLLHRVISNIFINNVDFVVINSYIEIILKNSLLKNTYTSSMPTIIHLLMNSKSSSYNILNKISQSTISDDKNSNYLWKNICMQIMNNLMIKLYRRLHSGGTDYLVEIPLLKNLKISSIETCKDMLASDSKKQAWFFKLLTMVAIHHDSILASNILFYIFYGIRELNQISFVVLFYHEVSFSHSDLMKNLLNKLFIVLINNSNTEEILFSLKKINCIFKLETSDNALQAKLFADALIKDMRNHLDDLANLLLKEDIQLQFLVLKLLSRLSYSRYSNFSNLLSLANHLTVYFFNCTKCKDTATMLRLSFACIDLLEIVSSAGLPIQSAVVRALLEKSIIKNKKNIFVKQENKSLIDENIDLSNTLSTSIIFHSGTINNSLKESLKQLKPTDKNSILSKQQLILHAIWTCASCQPNTDPSNKMNFELNKPSLEMSKLIATTLVERVSSDLMYVGIQWPVEDYIKVTIERDLFVRNQFNNNPILWDLMDLLAILPNGMFQASCLLRSLLATQMNYWELSREALSSSSPTNIAITCRIIEVMNKAQMLPDPLCYTACLVPHLTPYEVFLLLLNIWRYMKIIMNNYFIVQKPIININPTFTDVIHSIIQNNICTLWNKYTLFFKQ